MLRRAICGIVQGAGARLGIRSGSTLVEVSPDRHQFRADDVSMRRIVSDTTAWRGVLPPKRCARLVVPQEVISPESLPS